MRGLVLIVAIVAATAVGCSKPSPPTLVPVSVKATGLTQVGIELSALLNVTNPNAIPIDGQSVTAHIVVDKTIDMGSVTTTQGISLPAKKTTPVTVPLSVKWTSMAALLQVAASNRDVPYTVDGTITMGGALLNVGVPFHLDGTMTRDQIVRSAAHSAPGVPLVQH